MDHLNDPKLIKKYNRDLDRQQEKHEVGVGNDSIDIGPEEDDSLS